MKRLLASTALALALAGPGMAQDSNIFLGAPGENALRASDLIGARLYTSSDELSEDVASVNENWEDVGEISDIVLGSDGKITSVLADIGGFLGIGEKTVAVSMDQLEFNQEENGSYFIVVQASREQLEGAPEYGAEQMAAGDGSMEGGTAPSGAEVEEEDMAAADGAEAGAEAEDDTDLTAQVKEGAEEAGDETEQAANAVEETAEDAAEATEQAANDAAEATEETAEGAAQATEQAANEVEEEAAEAGAEMESAANEATDEGASDEEMAATEEEPAEGDTEMAATEEPAEGGDTEMTATEEEPAEGETDMAATEEPAEGGDTEMAATEEEPAEGETDMAATEEPAEGGDTEMAATEEEPAEGETDMAATEEPAEGGDTEMAATEEEPAEGETDMAATEEQAGGNGMQVEGYSSASMDELTSDDVTGARVYDSNDEWIGEIDELLLDDDGKITAAIIDVGGFLGIGEKPVRMTLDSLNIQRPDDGGSVRVYINASKDELDAMEEYEAG